MKNIMELCNVSNKYKTKGEWGIEIEVEGQALPDALPPDIWRIEADGSLRGESHEYVMPKPKDLTGVRTALTILREAYVYYKSTISESVRAGVHVHMNVQNWNVKQVFTFFTLYFMLEDILVKWCGENREGNLFCLRMKDAEQILFSMHHALDQRNLKYLSSEELRYCSLNPISMFKYGSLEFRAMRSTSDLSAIEKWVEILEELRDSSLKFSSPLDVVGQMSGDGETEFFRKLLPKNYQLLEYPEYDTTIRENCRRIQSIAFTVDWDDMSESSNNIFEVSEGF